MSSLLATLLVLSFVVCPSIALSQPASGTLGQVLSDFITNIWQPTFLLVAMSSAVVGLFLIAKGLMKIVKLANESIGSSSFGSAVTMIVSGLFLFILPDTAGLGMMTILGDVTGGETLGSATLDYSEDFRFGGNLFSQIIGGSTTVGQVESCINFDDSDRNDIVNPVQCMANNLATNVIPIATLVLFSLAFLIGFVGIANVLLNIANSQNNRGLFSFLLPLSMNIILMNASFLFTVVVETIFDPSSQILIGNELNASSSLLSWTHSDTVIQPWCDLLSRATVLLVFFGAFAFVRGLYMMKVVSEHGRQGGSYGMASVYMVSGMLLANIMMVVQIFGETLGINGQGFCN